MPSPCGKGRCPARADVYDWNTTEYRKGCRRTTCTSAHTLAEQRRKARKAEEALAAAAAAEAAPAAGLEPDGDEEPADTSQGLVQLIRADLDKLASDHPLKNSLTGIALSLAEVVQTRSKVPGMSAAGDAKQLVEVLERLLPTKGSMGDEVEKFLNSLADEDDADSPAG